MTKQAIIDRIKAVSPPADKSCCARDLAIHFVQSNADYDLKVFAWFILYGQLNTSDEDVQVFIKLCEELGSAGYCYNEFGSLPDIEE